MQVPQLSSATAWAIACPACMTLDLAASCAPFVTTLVHGTDIVPTFSSGAIDRLRDEVRCISEVRMAAVPDKVAPPMCVGPEHLDAVLAGHNVLLHRACCQALRSLCGSQASSQHNLMTYLMEP
jgi:hypothetical protein